MEKYKTATEAIIKERAKIMEIGSMVQYITKRKMLRIDKWRGENAWRCGLGWTSHDEFEFICEKPTLLEALNSCVHYLDK